MSEHNDDYWTELAREAGFTSRVKVKQIGHMLVRRGTPAEIARCLGVVPETVHRVQAAMERLQKRREEGERAMSTLSPHGIFGYLDHPNSGCTLETELTRQEPAIDTARQAALEIDTETRGFIDQLSAAYLKVTDLDPRDVQLIQQTSADGLTVTWRLEPREGVQEARVLTAAEDGTPVGPTEVERMLQQAQRAATRPPDELMAEMVKERVADTNAALKMAHEMGLRCVLSGEPGEETTGLMQTVFGVQRVAMEKPGKVPQLRVKITRVERL